MDGRVLRGEVNRQAIVDALLELVAEEGSLPTAQAISARAGVAKRSVFHHFADLEALLAAGAVTQEARYWHVLRLPTASGSLERRIATTVERRARLYESIGDVRRVAVLHEQEYPVVAEGLRYSRGRLRDHMRRALQPEFSALDRDAANGILAVGSWEAWDVLRRHQRLSPAAARASVRATIEAVFERALKRAVSMEV